MNIDNQVLLNVTNNLVDGYHLNNFKEIKFKFLRKITSNKRDCESLNRLVTGYSYTRLFLYKMRLVDSPLYKCGKDIQDVNHVF